MEFFDKIGKAASETYKKTTEKADKLAKEVKLKMKINEEKSRIEELYKEIGEAVYRMHIARKNDNAEEQIKDACCEIDKISLEIEKANEELLKIRDKRKCENCHEEIDIESKYCPKCGTEQKENKIQDDIVIEEIKEEKENIDAEENDNNTESQ